VRMFWKACSTFEASNAEVSMKERLFSAVNGERAREFEVVSLCHNEEAICFESDFRIRMKVEKEQRVVSELFRQKHRPTGPTISFLEDTDQQKP